MNAKKIEPIHPGEILFEEFLKPMNLSQNRLAMDIRVPARRINEIVHGKRRISADSALRLGRFFNNSPQFWLGLQMDYDLDVAEDKLSDRLDQEIQPYAAWIGRLVHRSDYMFTLRGDKIMGISQSVISSKIKFSKNVRAFTEKGVAMLSSVLRIRACSVKSFFIISSG